MKKDQGSQSKSGSKAEFRKRFVASEKTPTFTSWVRAWRSDNSFFGRLLNASSDRFKIGRMALCFLFSLFFVFLITVEWNLAPRLKLGEVAEKNLRSPFEFEVLDEEATDRKREEAAKAIPPVFDYYPNIYEKDLDAIYSTFSTFRMKLRDYQGKKKDKTSFIKSSREEFEKSMGISTSERTFSWLAEQRFNIKLQRAVANTVEKWSTSFIADVSKESTTPERFALRAIGQDGEAVGSERLVSDRIKTLEVGFSELNQDFGEASPEFSKYDRKKLISLVRQLRKPNLIKNLNLTSKRRAQAIDKVLPVVILVKANQTIISQGSIIQEQDILLSNAIIERMSSQKQKTKVFVFALILGLVLMIGLSLLKKSFGISFRDIKQDVAILATVSILGTILIRGAFFLFDGALSSKFGPQVPNLSIGMIVPFALTAMLATMLVKSKPLVWIYIIYSSIGFSFLVPGDYSYLLILLIGNFLAIRTFESCKSRKDFYLAGIFTGVIVGVLAVFLYIVNVDAISELRPQHIGWFLGAGILGGVLSSIFAVTLVPLFESVFDVMTDLKLLELSSLTHPLLKDLMVRAPGTYHHCVVVGSMVEVASYEIGVNGLLAKVMAYFHDVGKMEHAEYFIENQRKSSNPHDNISPYLSKTIIIAHVKDGVELVLKHRLGKAIVDGVKQHHGTTLISYFFEKAKREADDPVSVKEEEFRYNGPKPLFKESAILMLADSIEAAARTLEDPSPLRIQNLIDSMVERKFTDGQLNDCNITFEELEKIKKAFYKVLVGVYHRRIDYPAEISSKFKESSGSVSQIKNIP